MTKFLSVLTASAAVLNIMTAMPLSAAASAYQDYEYVYSEETGGIEITAYTGSDVHVYVPYKIDGIKVTSIGDDAFENNSAITFVDLPDTVVSIGAGAFYCCENLRKVQLPDDLETIEQHAFSGCTSLIEADLPQGLKNIEWCAFQLTSISNLVIPSSVEKLSPSAFNHTLFTFSVYIEDGLTEIGEEAFLTAENLNWVYIPRSVEVIGDHAFGYATYDYDRYNDELVIYGHNFTAAYAYAAAHNITFKNCVVGDVDFNGSINSLDASWILEYYAGAAIGVGIPSNRVKEECADTNADGAIDALDASYVLTYYAYTATGGNMSFEEFMSDKA
ncbi:MAG: leucine-rich repeat protein [Ruminococcus sp.]|nr:leucine-rich repeat protein [Ruminococcus sp.]